jgi:DNA-nicking Smr family endonuclease
MSQPLLKAFMNFQCDNHNVKLMSPDDPIDFPINGILDLHTFKPSDVKDLVPVYLEECRKLNILQVRIIHGKGTGTVRRMVQSILGKLPFVVSYRPAEEGAGGWGAMIVVLRGLTETNQGKEKAG